MNWTLFIAVLSLVVSFGGVAIPPMYRRLFQRPKLLMHTAGLVQVHFGPYGPGMSLGGAIQALHRPLFLASIEALVIHEASKEEHTLVWRILFPDAFSTDPGSPVKKDLPTGVMVNPMQAYRYNAFFADPSVEDRDVREVADRVRKDWIALMVGILQRKQIESPESIADLMANVDQTRKELFLEFMKTSTFRWAVEKLASTCYWKVGTYSLSIRARAGDTDEVFASRWRFELDETCVRNLKSNTEVAIAELAGLTGMSWNGCTLDYLPSAGT